MRAIEIEADIDDLTARMQEYLDEGNRGAAEECQAEIDRLTIKLEAIQDAE